MVKNDTFENEMSRTKIQIKERVFGIFGENYRNKIINKLQSKLKMIDYLLFFFAWSGGLLAVIAAEFNMKFTFNPDDGQLNHFEVFIENDWKNKQAVNIARAINSGFTFLTILLLILHYKIILKIKKMKMVLGPEAGLKSSGLWKWLLLEIIINALHMPPYTDGWTLMEERNPDQPQRAVMTETIIMILLLFFRAYHIIKLVANHSRFNKYDCEKICLSQNTPGDTLFAIKAEFKTNPFLLVTVIMITSIFVFGYSVRNIELFFMYGQPADKVQDWRYYWNGFWCVIITMATVGFGDIYPVSILGRCIIIIACLWGTFLISLMVAALTFGIEFNAQERVSYDTIKSVNTEVEHGVIGTVLIQTVFRYNKLIQKAKANPALYKSPGYVTSKSKLFVKMKEILQQFRSFKMRKSELIKYLHVQLAIKKIDDNLNVGIDRIKEQIEIVGEVNRYLETYEKNQRIIKQRCLELYKEVEMMSLLKEKYLKNL
jgi:hypothetical protein